MREKVRAADNKHILTDPHGSCNRALSIMKETKGKLYKWQNACLEEWETHGFHGIVGAVTGSGKTRLALAAIEKLRGRFPELQVRVVVPTIALANQWLIALTHAAECEAQIPALVGGGRHADSERDILVYVVNSARDTLTKHIRRSFALGKHVLLICDECHHYQSRENRKIFSFLRKESGADNSGADFAKSPDSDNSGTEDLKRTDSDRFPTLYTCMGLSATPFETQHDDVLIHCLGPEIYSYRLQEAVADEVISRYVIFETAVDFLPSEADAYRAASYEVSLKYAQMLRAYPSLERLAGTRAFIRAVTVAAAKADMDSSDPAAAYLLATYARKEISVLAEARIRCALELIARLRPDDRILVFCERIEQAENLYSLLSRRWGSQVSIYHSGMNGEARKRVLCSFAEGSVRILVSCRCLDEGVDVPDANIGIVLSSTSVSRQRIQRLGRVIRSWKGKDLAVLYYLYIPESSDESMYLPESGRTGDSGEEERNQVALLRYYTDENDFSNEVYEYAALALLSQFAERGATEEVLAEIRRCLMEGIVRADYFLDEEILIRKVENSFARHERNYWRIIRQTRRCREKEE